MSAERSRLELARENVRENRELDPSEKETTIRFGKRDDVARVFTAEAGIARRVLAHPESDVAHMNVSDDDGGTRRMELSEYDGGPVVSVAADVPVGALQIKSSARKNDQHAAIVSHRVLESEGSQ